MAARTSAGGTPRSNAGASTDGIWIAGKPLSDDVAALLQTHGIEPPDDED